MNRTHRASPFAKTVVYFTFFFLIAIGILAYLLFERSGSGGAKDLMVARGASVTSVASLLFKERIIGRERFFKVLLKITNGEYRVRAGEFRFREGMSPVEALYVLYYSEPIVHQVTIAEGFNIRQIAATLEKAGLIDSKIFLKHCFSREVAAQHKVDSPTLEGFLFPDTYTFSKVDGESKIIETMIKRFFARFTPEQRKIAEGSGFSMLQVVTLASIIEKETGDAKERPLIASVFLNRLRKNMRLQSDPTVIYGIENFNGNLTKADLQKKTPFNTYQNRGLPPTPIASPGWASIQSVIAPAETDYLYFVSNNEGSHVFSSTYSEHQKNVNRYQKRSHPRQNASR